MQKNPPKAFTRRVLHRMLRTKFIGRTFCAVTRGMGLEKISRRASRHSRFVPKCVPLPVLGADGTRRVGSIYSDNGRDQIARNIWVHGLLAYEAPLPELFMRLVKGAQTVLDVGANSGLYAILAALTEPRCSVISFEPLPEALKCLRANLRANQLEARVTVVEAAAGSSQGQMDLFIPENKFGEVLETSASLVREFRPKHSNIIKVRVETLDDYVAANCKSRVSILRADVEGAEHQVLQGATEILKNHRPLVFVEVLADITATYLEPIR